MNELTQRVPTEAQAAQLASDVPVQPVDPFLTKYPI